jgi:hypothetical protein
LTTTAPDETVKDKIFFVFNNVSKQNMNIKANELRSILHSEDWPYLAQHLVINRASIEPNFHALYLEFLDYLKIPGLLELVLSSTYAGTIPMPRAVLFCVFAQLLLPQRSRHFCARSASR